MIHSLESDLLSIDISSQGAELMSIFSKKTKTEYLWQGDADIWPQRAPVLFPFVGRLKDGQYTYAGKTYKMPIHGFASNSEFSTSGISENNIVFTLEDSKETRAIYPFSFTFRVMFIVKWNTLETIYQVVNKTNGPMYFSFGSHEGFRCPRQEGESFDDYYLEFDHDNFYNSLVILDSGLQRDSFTVLENAKRIPLSYGLFKQDSIVFAGVPSGKVILGSHKNPARIEMAYDNAPNLVLWTQQNAPYICIEPWCGLPDFADSDGELVNKEGIIALEKGETFNWRHSITIYE